MKILLFILVSFLLFFLISIAVAVGVNVGMENFFDKKGAKNGNSENTDKTT
ncbi:MAG: hypothetical protein IKC11_02945 [Clostridia bacterium]|nr:hypothetical protein [Clostridia bacterium]